MPTPPLPVSLRAALALTAALLSLGCGEVTPVNADALRQMFPDRAAEVLETGGGFAPGAAGFEAIPQRGDAWISGEIALTLPTAGSEAIRLVLGGGREVRVREEGVEGDGEIVGRAVAYRRAGGTSFWSATRGGAEEWLLFDASRARGNVPAAAWEIEGGTPRQEGDAVEIVDEDGVARLRVTAPAAYAEGGSHIEARLDARGSRIELRVDAGGKAALVDPIWVPTISMNVTRSRHTATVLNDGRVLVTGGRNADGRLESAEIFDPQTNFWVLTNPMDTPREEHTATLLQDGRVLVAGGFDGNYYLSTAVLYNPTTGTWADDVPMATTRQLHTATLLQDGRVLVVGGQTTGQKPLDRAEIYTPAPAGAGSWAPAALIPPASGLPNSGNHVRHTATLLQDGRVLIAGGHGEVQLGLRTAILYDPVVDTWTYTGDMTFQRYLHTATLLPGGDVLAAGYGDVAERYHPDTGVWTQVGQIPYPPTSLPIAARLANDFVLVAGGQENDGSLHHEAALFDPATNSWAPTDPMYQSRYHHTASLLHDGRVLVAGGNPGTTATAELHALSPTGAPCASAGECQSGHCADGVCCNSTCNAGACDACSIAAGAPADGTCAPLTGTPCDDADACTPVDTCQGGICTGAPVSCPALAPCFGDGACDPVNGTCIYARKEDGSDCEDGNLCTQGEACLSGVCEGGTARNCPALNECHLEGACEPATGMCSTPLKPDGTPCADGVCQNGACIHPGEDGCVEKDCGEYECKDGACIKSCQSIRDCVPPYVCVPSGACLPPDQIDIKPGSLGCHLAGAPGEGGPWALLALGAGLAAARRRPRVRQAR